MVPNHIWTKNSRWSSEILYLGLPGLPVNTFPAWYITEVSFNSKQSRASSTTVTTLSPTVSASKHLSIILYRQSSQYCTWSRVSESPFSNFNCLKISNNTLRRWFLAATWQATLSAIFDSRWQEKAAWLRTIPITLLSRLIFVHWVLCRIWHTHNTTSQNEQDRNTGTQNRIKNSKSYPILDDNIF